MIQNPNKSDFSDLLFRHRVQFMNEHLLQLDSNDCNKNRVGHKWNYYRQQNTVLFVFVAKQFRQIVTFQMICVR